MTCRTDVLAATIAFFDAAVLDETPTCTDPAEHEVAVARTGDGWETVTHVKVCTAHERLASLAVGYRSSIRLRVTT